MAKCLIEKIKSNLVLELTAHIFNILHPIETLPGLLPLSIALFYFCFYFFNVFSTFEGGGSFLSGI